MNETLEAMARAAFRSWFVDFDPVRAEMEGRQPEGMDSQPAVLFPDAPVESTLGAAPSNWKVGRLDDLVLLQRGFDLPPGQ
jgi:type I restriction enzyme S subunit